MDGMILAAKGTYKEVDDAAKPFKIGDQIELLVEETYLHNSNDALARTDGYIIQIINGKKYMGKRITVEIISVSKTSAVAKII